jgi:hypothetical protein
LRIDEGTNKNLRELAQVAEDKLAAVFNDRVCIYSLAGGSLLVSKTFPKRCHRKILYMENKYVIVYSKVLPFRHTRLLVIDLNELKCEEMEIAEKATSLVYLENGTLIFASKNPSTWKADS